MRLRITGIFILITIFVSQVSAQSFIALSSGISTDINNERPFLWPQFMKHAVAIISMPFSWEGTAFFIEAIQDIGFNRLSKSDAYTANPDLSENVVLTEEVKHTSFLIGIGGAIVLYTNKRNNQITVDVSKGICSESYTVDFRNYDKVNYEVLNPDVTNPISGLYASIAMIYNFRKRKQDMFIMLRLQSPSSGGFGRYKLSFNNTAPLQLTFGYKLFTSKK